MTPHFFARVARTLFMLSSVLLLISQHSWAGEGSAAGVSWTVPKRWTEEPRRAMRVATYRIPAAPKDSEPAECGVFYFGAGQGGEVASNVDRWISQFEGHPTPVRSTRK